MAKKKISPELRERLRETREEGARARAEVQAIIDRYDERRRRHASSRWRRALRRLHLA